MERIAAHSKEKRVRNEELGIQVFLPLALETHAVENASAIRDFHLAG
jgi:hypothetical protein